MYVTIQGRRRQSGRAGERPTTYLAEYVYSLCPFFVFRLIFLYDSLYPIETPFANRPDPDQAAFIRAA